MPGAGPADWGCCCLPPLTEWPGRKLRPGSKASQTVCQQQRRWAWEGPGACPLVRCAPHKGGLGMNYQVLQPRTVRGRVNEQDGISPWPVPGREQARQRVAPNEQNVWSRINQRTQSACSTAPPRVPAPGQLGQWDWRLRSCEVSTRPPSPLGWYRGLTPESSLLPGKSAAPGEEVPHGPLGPQGVGCGS